MLSTLSVVNTNDSGAGSLRAEIAAAHNGDTIQFDPNLFASGPQTIALTSGELLIKHNLTISGPGAAELTISGDNLSRVFELGSSQAKPTVTISGVTLSGGDGVAAAGSSNYFDGSGGAVLNWGTLTVNNCTLSGNSAHGSGNGGGAIENQGTLTVTGSTLSGNSETGGGLGGAIENAGGTLKVSSSTLSGNTAYGGGAILNEGTLLISASTLSGNSAKNPGGVGGFGNGGAIQSFPVSSRLAYQLNVSTCIFTNNSAGHAGGAISVESSCLITGSTFGGAAGLGNSATFGGAIYVQTPPQVYANSVTLSGCTLSYNAATGEGGGLYVTSGAIVTIENSTSIIDNTAPVGYGPDVYNTGVLYVDSSSAIGSLDGNPAQPI
ncbi:MAG TPA: hypothetical protein VFI31_12000 [Pirellulales bacterium]|nr:hypothetical protein [Pirellulales bacterium]